MILLHKQGAVHHFRRFNQSESWNVPVTIPTPSTRKMNGKRSKVQVTKTNATHTHMLKTTNYYCTQGYAIDNKATAANMNVNRQ